MGYPHRRLLALVVAAVLCGESVPLADKVFGSARVVEFTLSFAAKKPSTTGRVLFPVGSPEPAPELKHALTSSSPCQSEVKKRKQLKLLAFFDPGGRQLVGVEQSLGHGTDLDPGYPALVEAVLEAKGWQEERMRAVGPEQLWQRQRQALLSQNPYLRRLAAAFLASHQAAEVVDAAWGVAGTPARKEQEAKATLPAAPLCRASK